MTWPFASAAAERQANQCHIAKTGRNQRRKIEHRPMAAPAAYRVNAVNPAVGAWCREVGGVYLQGRTGLVSPGFRARHAVIECSPRWSKGSVLEGP